MLIDIITKCGWFILAIIVIVLMRAIMGRDKTNALLSKILSPSSIILFHLTGISLIGAIANKLGIHIQILESISIRVAIDSALVTLIVNLLLPAISNPAKVKVLIRSNRNLKGIIADSVRPVKAMYQIEVDFKNKIIMWLYRDRAKVKILTPYHASFAIDNETQYGNQLNTDNISQYILVNLCNILDSSGIKGSLYIDISILSNVLIPWEDDLQCRLECNSKILNVFAKAFIWSFDQNTIKITHQGIGENNND